MEHSPLPSSCDISSHLLVDGSDLVFKDDSWTQNFRELQILGKACAQISIAAVALEVTANASKFATCFLCLPHLECDEIGPTSQCPTNTTSARVHETTGVSKHLIDSLSKSAPTHLLLALVTHSTFFSLSFF
jgi:hypothetical protein